MEMQDNCKEVSVPESFTSDCLDRDKILAFAEKYALFTDEVKEEVLSALEEIKKDARYIALCQKLLYALKNNLPTAPLAPDFSDGLKAEYAMFFPVWYMAEEMAGDMEKRGVPHESISKSFGGIIANVIANKTFKGRMGTSAYFSWLPHYAHGTLFRINDFQYEKTEKDGKVIIAIHIPAGTKLNVRKNLLSFQEALDFFEKYYPEMDVFGFSCESWLLSPDIEVVMGRKTNISRFGDMFERYAINETGEAVFRFVYKVMPPYPIEELPEETSLQRRLKAYMKQGKKVCACGGLISKERLSGLLKQTMEEEK